MGSRVYAGRTATTRTERVVYSCPCGERFAAEVWRAVDARDQAEAKKLQDGSLNQVRCPSCEARADVQVPVVFHDGAAERLVLVLPDGMRHRELEERAALFTQLAEDGVAPPAYVLGADVVFGAAGLRALLAPPASEFEAQSEPSHPAVRTAEQPMLAIVDERRDKSGPALSLLPSLQDDETPAPQPHWGPTQVDRRVPEPAAVAAQAANEPSRPHVAVPDPRAAVTERWIAGREGPAAFLVEDQVLLCAALPQAALEAFIPGHVELRVQLHRLPSYPLLALTLLALDPPGGPSRPRPEEARVLSLALDIARAAHRVVLEALGRRCALKLELYDSQYLPVVALSVAGRSRRTCGASSPRPRTRSSGWRRRRAASSARARSSSRPATIGWAVRRSICRATKSRSIARAWCARRCRR